MQYYARMENLGVVPPPKLSGVAFKHVLAFNTLVTVLEQRLATMLGMCFLYLSTNCTCVQIFN